ncbi:MAG: PAS domain S-box protein, partial [Candidatus Bathyarchaeia archaeon]
NLVVFHDVTLRKENARRLKEYSERMEALVEEKVKEIQDREEKFRNLAEHSPNMIFICQEGKVVYVNKEAEKAMGYRKEEFYSSEFNFLDLITPENRELVQSNFAKHTKGEDTAPYEYGLMTKDGRRIDAIINTKLIDYNREQAILGIVTDITERKKAEAQIIEQLHMLDLTHVIVKNMKDEIVFWNSGAQKLYGFSKEEALGKIPCELLKTKLPKPIEQIKEKLLLTGKWEGELVHEKADGSNIFVASHWVLHKDNDGKPVAIIEVNNDITERKKAEEALRESEQRWATTLASIGDAIIATDFSGRITFMNGVAEKLTGWTLSEASKKPVREVFHIVNEQTRLEVEDPVTKVFEKGLIVGLANHTVLIKKDGTEIAIDDSEAPIKDKEGKITGVVLVFHDITEIRRVQDALMESESQYRQLVNVAQEGIWALDTDYRTVFVNPQITEMLGFAKSEMAGKSLFEFLDKKNIEQAKHFLEQIKQGAKRHFDCEFGRKDGSRFYASIAASVIYDDEGTPSGTLAMVSDITCRKVLERKVNNYSKHLKSMVELRTAQLKDANERLVRSERLAAIGELAGMVGHDLRNPLTGIKNAAYYLKKRGPTISEAQAKEMLEIIDKAIDHSNKIINDLLDYSREMHLEFTECTSRALLDEAVRMIRVPDRIQIVNHVLGETRIRVDADKIMRVFINLIKNAVDAMPEKGTLEITSRQTRDNLEIDFADTGMGIPEETLPKIFSPLFTTKAQGMGFGLAICKRIIESHGGTITVKTTVNQGTTFTVTLPVKSKVEVGDEKTWINMPESLLSTTRAY